MTPEQVIVELHRTRQMFYVVVGIGIAWTFVHVVLDERWQRGMNDRLRECLTHFGKAIDATGRVVMEHERRLGGTVEGPGLN